MSVRSPSAGPKRGGELTSEICNEGVDTIGMLNAILANTRVIEVVARVGAVCAESIAAGGKVMFCGNGGSAADSQHLQEGHGEKRGVLPTVPCRP
jgi:phosphoheptose isomerase